MALHPIPGAHADVLAPQGPQAVPALGDDHQPVLQGQYANASQSFDLGGLLRPSPWQLRREQVRRAAHARLDTTLTAVALLAFRLANLVSQRVPARMFPLHLRSLRKGETTPWCARILKC